MSEIYDIKRRQAAVAQTRQITNAMYLLASTRMKREAKRVEYNREYYYRVRAAVKDILDKSGKIEHPYLEHRSGNRAAILVIAGDKGLCGTYNSDVLKYSLEIIDQHPTHYIATAGRMATDFFKRRGVVPDIELVGVSQNPSLFMARRTVDNLFKLYDEDLVDEIYIVYTRFVNAAVHYPKCVRLLPLSIGDYDDVALEFDYDADMLYEPSPAEVFNLLVPQYAVGLIFGALTQSYASENCARMNAMQSATRNADEMLEKLARQYNAERQLAITNEIAEITSGAQGAESFRNGGKV